MVTTYARTKKEVGIYIQPHGTVWRNGTSAACSGHIKITENMISAKTRNCSGQQEFFEQ
jgi:hypothetical protein